MLTLPDLIAHSVPDAPRASTQPVPLRCAGCPSLATRHNPDLVPPAGTSARCTSAEGGRRLIGHEWQPQDRAPHWCPRRRASA